MHVSLVQQLNNVLPCMEENNLTSANFISHILGSTDIHHQSARDSLMTHAVRICAIMHREEHSHSHITLWATMIVRETLCAKITELSLEKHGLCFRATSVTAEQLESAFMHQLAKKMQEQAMGGNVNVGDEDMDICIDEEMDLGEFGGDDIGGMVDNEDDIDDAFEKCRSRKRQCHAAERNSALLTIVTVVMISICLQTSNEQCNLLQGWLGFFMKSTCVPKKVVEVFAHAGLSISLTSIHNAVSSISKEISSKIKHEVQTLQAGFAYDNFDIQFKAVQPTLEHQGCFVSATSATIIPLYGIDNDNVDALQSSAQLWDCDSCNLSPSVLPVMTEWKSFLQLHKSIKHIPID
ncbi:hypothetical protein BD769DRAFT_1363266 [Suillus cothurnatus]|nr:hypothetical protein BD769DRAFT_1363266 [Suillus cothurnatus]